MTTCPCGSRKHYEQCCGPFLDGREKAPTAVALMRSRYTAYSKKDAGYLLRTWHPADRPAPGSLVLQQEITWSGLEILTTREGGVDDEKGMVEFVAYYRCSGQRRSLHEKSTFVRQDGQWLYADGEMFPEEVQPRPKINRNDPCPCGSGRKFKKCCAA